MLKFAIEREQRQACLSYAEREQIELKQVQHDKKATKLQQVGIKGRMTAARLGRRQTQNETIEAQAHEIEQLKERIKQLEEELMRYKSQG